MPTSSDRRFQLRYVKYRLALLLSIVVIVPLGYVIRFSQGPLPERMNDLLGSVAYEIFWVLLFLLLVPRASPLRVAIGVCVATCGLEFLQLWKPPLLQAARATLIGRLVLGNNFDWSDFPSYFIGSFCGWLWGRSLRHFKRNGQRNGNANAASLSD